MKHLIALTKNIVLLPLIFHFISIIDKDIFTLEDSLNNESGNDNKSMI